MDREILIVSDDQRLCQGIESNCKNSCPENIHIKLVHDTKSAADRLRNHPVAMVIVGKLPHEESVISFLFYIWHSFPDIPIFNATGEQEFPESLIIEEDGLTIHSNHKKLPLQKWPVLIKKALKREKEGGYLRANDVSNFTQMIENEVKTCTVRIIDHTNTRLGILFFDKGLLKNARLKTVQGEVAAYEILSWENVKVWIQNSCDISPLKITSNLQALLIESHVKKDHNDQSRSDSSAWIDAAHEERKSYRRLVGTLAMPQQEVSKNDKGGNPVYPAPTQAPKKSWSIPLITTVAIGIVMLFGTLFYLTVQQEESHKSSLVTHQAVTTKTNPDEIRSGKLQEDDPTSVPPKSNSKNPPSSKLSLTGPNNVNQDSLSTKQKEVNTIVKPATTDQTLQHPEPDKKDQFSHLSTKQNEPTELIQPEPSVNVKEPEKTAKLNNDTATAKTDSDRPATIEKTGYIYIHYTHKKNRSVADKLAAHLTAHKYQVHKVERAIYKNNDIRYFHPADSESAIKLKAVLLDFMTASAPHKKMARLKIKNLAERYPKDVPGQLEIWLNLSGG